MTLAPLTENDCPRLPETVAVWVEDDPDAGVVGIVASTLGAAGVRYDYKMFVTWGQIVATPAVLDQATRTAQQRCYRDAQTGHITDKNLPTILGCPAGLHAEFNGRVMFKRYQEYIAAQLAGRST